MTMTADQATRIDAFFAALPEAHSLRGANSVTVATVRKTIRAELAMAIQMGVMPQGAKFSVRGDHNTVTVEITTWPTFPLSTEYTDAIMSDAVGKPEMLKAWNNADWRSIGSRYARRELTEEINDALVLIERVASRHNFDESQIEVDYFHCGYYLHVEADAVRHAAEHGIREEMNPEATAKRQMAHAAAQRLGAKVTKSVCGRSGVERCGEWALDRLLKLDAMAAGRPLVWCAARRRWVIDDTAQTVVAA